MEIGIAVAVIVVAAGVAYMWKTRKKRFPDTTPVPGAGGQGGDSNEQLK